MNGKMTSNSNSVHKGQVLMKESPFVYALKSKFKQERCDFCLSGEKVLKCSGCKYVSYCNRTCQRMGWDVHKDECPLFKKVYPRIVPDAARILTRVIFKLKRGGGLERSFYTKTNSRTFKDLMSHYTDIKDDKKRMEHFTALYNVLLEFIGEDDLPNSAELLGMYGRMIINGFSILDVDLNSIGTGIYLGVSIIDHSCDPNAVVVFEGTTIYIRSLVDLPVMDWSKIFITYVELINSPQERQKDLLNTYYFLCECRRCKDVEEVKLNNSMQCPNNNCLAPVPVEPEGDLQDINVSHVCPQCKTGIKPELYKKYLEVREFVNIQLQNMKDVFYIDVAKVCLEKQEDLFHPLNLQRVKILDAAFESSLNLGQWENAEWVGQLLIPGYRRYYGELHPLSGLLQLKVGKILVYLGRNSEARPFLQGAKDVLLITHGREHPLYTDQLVPLFAEIE